MDHVTLFLWWALLRGDARSGLALFFTSTHHYRDWHDAADAAGWVQTA